MCLAMARRSARNLVEVETAPAVSDGAGGAAVWAPAAGTRRPRTLAFGNLETFTELCWLPPSTRIEPCPSSPI